jgi:hypothetical protein
LHEAGEEVFAVMTAAIVTAMKAGGLVPATSGRNAALGVLVAQTGPERVGVKALVGHQPMLPHGGPQRFHRVQVVLRSWGQPDGHGPAVPVRDRRRLGVEPTLGAADRLRSLATRQIGPA